MKEIHALEQSIRATGDEFVYVSQSQYIENKVADYVQKEEEPQRKEEAKDEDRIYEIALEKGLQVLSGLHQEDCDDYLDDIEYPGYPELTIVKKKETKEGCAPTEENNTSATPQPTTTTIGESQLPPPPPPPELLRGITENKPSTGCHAQVAMDVTGEVTKPVETQEVQGDKPATGLLEEMLQKGIVQGNSSNSQPKVVVTPNEREDASQNSQSEQSQDGSIQGMIVESVKAKEETRSKLSNILSFACETVGTDDELTTAPMKHEQEVPEPKKKTSQLDFLFASDADDIDVLDVLAESLDKKTQKVGVMSTKHEDTYENKVDQLLESKMERNKEVGQRRSATVDDLFSITPSKANSEAPVTRGTQQKTSLVDPLTGAFITERKEGLLPEMGIRKDEKEQTEAVVESSLTNQPPKSSKSKKRADVLFDDIDTTTPVAVSTDKNPKRSVEDLFEDSSITVNSSAVSEETPISGEPMPMGSDKHKSEGSQQKNVERKQSTEDVTKVPETGRKVEELFGDDTPAKNNKTVEQVFFESSVEKKKSSRKVDSLFEDDESKKEELPKHPRRVVDPLFDEKPKESADEHLIEQKRKVDPLITDDSKDIQQHESMESDKVAAQGRSRRTVDSLFAEPSTQPTSTTEEKGPSQNRPLKRTVDSLFSDEPLKPVEEEHSVEPNIKETQPESNTSKRQVDFLFDLDDNTKATSERKKKVDMLFDYEETPKTVASKRSVDSLFDDTGLEQQKRSSVILSTLDEKEEKTGVPKTKESRTVVDSLFDEEIPTKGVKGVVDTPIGDSGTSKKSEPTKRVVTGNKAIKSKLEGLIGAGPMVQPHRVHSTERSDEVPLIVENELKHDGTFSSRKNVRKPKNRRPITRQNPTNSIVQQHEAQHTEVSEETRNRILDFLDGKDVSLPVISESNTTDDGSLKQVPDISKEQKLEEIPQTVEAEGSQAEEAVADKRENTEGTEECSVESPKEDDYGLTTSKVVDSQRICEEYDFDSFF